MATTLPVNKPHCAGELPAARIIDAQLCCSSETDASGSPKAFKGSLPAADLDSSSDAAEVMLSASISTLPHPIEQGDAQQFAEEVIEHHTLVSQMTSSMQQHAV